MALLGGRETWSDLPEPVFTLSGAADPEDGIAATSWSSLCAYATPVSRSPATCYSVRGPATSRHIERLLGEPSI
ncbi:MAG: hypothetical protein HOV76_00570 [Hamadaea sp.]|nr:hypothetical protein [Hamadaea sp.]